MIVLDFPSVPQSQGALFRLDRLHSNIFRVGCVHIEWKFGVKQVISLGGFLLLIDVPDGVNLVNILVQNHHDFVFAVGHFVKLSAQDASHVAADDHDVVLLQILFGGLPFVEDPSEGLPG